MPCGSLSFYIQCYLWEFAQVTVCIQPWLYVISKQTVKWLWETFRLLDRALVLNRLSEDFIVL